MRPRTAIAAVVSSVVVVAVLVVVVSNLTVQSSSSSPSSSSFLSSLFFLSSNKPHAAVSEDGAEQSLVGVDDSVKLLEARDVVQAMNKIVSEVNERVETIQQEINMLADRQEKLIKANIQGNVIEHANEVVNPPPREEGEIQQHATNLPTPPQQQKRTIADATHKSFGANDRVEENIDYDNPNESNHKPFSHRQDEMPHEIPENIEALRERANSMNKDQTIMNKHLCPWISQVADNAVVIVVMVHNRLSYFAEFLNSLKDIQNIEKSFLVISQDVFSDDIDRLLDSVDFMCFIRIFYPGSLQLNPNQFPGADPNDCPRDINMEDALKIGCNNARTPDHFKHYREARYTVIKHHWFWKLNFVFDKMPIIKSHTGLKLLVEEDHYLAPDSLYMLLKTREKAQQEKLSHGLLVLGDYRAGKGLFLGDRVNRMPWFSSHHNMGMALDRDLFEKIKSCSHLFCEFDDYNWDWSLNYLSTKQCFGPQILYALVMHGQRIQHVGACSGTHTRRAACNDAVTISRVKKLFSENTGAMFPPNVNIVNVRSTQPRVKPGFGGWGDKRDIDLCKSFVTN